MNQDFDQRPTAFPLQFDGPGMYQKAFAGTGLGIVLEENDTTGYLYATSEDFDHIFDAIHLWDTDTPEQLKRGEEILIVWNSELLKAGVFYRRQFRAIISFREQRACGRSGFPLTSSAEWGTTSHSWDDNLAKGLR
jgi:hypothetical protein